MEQLLRCSWVSRPHSSGPRKKAGLRLRRCPAPSATAVVFLAHCSFLLCLPRSLSSRTAEQDLPEEESRSPCIPLVFGIFLQHLYGMLDLPARFGLVTRIHPVVGQLYVYRSQNKEEVWR